MLVSCSIYVFVSRISLAVERDALTASLSYMVYGCSQNTPIIISCKDMIN
ncbi:hypothetical protein BVRB_9g220790 [Beta vulgaris subsp. vulgaris]|nr:hypothetical protein BVRB_9g220790 [Beta vulgaris subsp. vulgaris]